MIHIAIVEDETPERKKLKEYIDRFSKEEQIPIRVSTFEDGLGITSSYKADYDIILLDIQMEIIDGLEAAKIIRSKDEEVFLIFITNMVQYALKGYSVNAHNFILKPVSYFAFSEELRKVFRKLEQRKDKSIPLKVADGIIRLNLKNFYFAEMVNRKVILHTRDDEHIFSGTLLKLESLLNDTRFFRCHSGFLVNIQNIKEIQANSVILEFEDREIPISRHKKKELKAILISYLQEQI